MSDMLLVILAGNLVHDIEMREHAGERVGVSQAATARQVIHAGMPQEQRTVITLEIRGTSRIREAERRYRRGSRVLITGYLELRRRREVEQWPAADGSGSVAVTAEREDLVLVVERMLDAGGISDVMEPPTIAQPATRGEPERDENRRGRPWTALESSASSPPLDSAERQSQGAAARPRPASPEIDSPHSPDAARAIRPPWDWKGRG